MTSLPVASPQQARLKENFPGGYTTSRDEFKKWLKDLGPSPSAPGSIKAVSAIACRPTTPGDTPALAGGRSLLETTPSALRQICNAASPYLPPLHDALFNPFSQELYSDASGVKVIQLDTTNASAKCALLSQPRAHTRRKLRPDAAHGTDFHPPATERRTLFSRIPLTQGTAHAASAVCAL